MEVKEEKKHNYILNFKKQEIKERKIKTKCKKKNLFAVSDYYILLFCGNSVSALTCEAELTIL